MESNSFRTIILVLIYFLSSITSFAQLNFDFENSLENWTSDGTVFKDQPEKGNTVRTYRVRPDISKSIGGDYWRGIPHSIGHHGNHWVTSYKINIKDSISANDSLGNLPIGTLTSDEFTISSDKIYFLIGGNGGSIELWIGKDDDYSITPEDDSSLLNNYYMADSKVSLNKTEVMSREYFDTQGYMNKKAKIKIIDSDITKHINIDDFYFGENESDKIIDFKFRTSYSNDPDKYDKLKYFKDRDKNLPLWGFIDTHGHWMNNVGFGGDFLYGKPYGKIDTALKDCEDIHGPNGMGFGNFLIGKSFLVRYMPEGATKEGHITSGYPDFKGWPSFRSIIHQSMHVDWVRRAYEGGLRLLVCPMGNNLNLANLMRNIFDRNDYSDTVVVRKEVEYLKKMIEILRPEGWVDIAYSSEDARKLIMENKLAVVLGMEVDQPGGFLYLDNKDLEKNKYLIDNYLKYVYNDLGIRHMFPIHHADNAFGGFSLYETEKYCINNFHLKNLKDIKPYTSRYVGVDSSSLVSFRLGEKRGFFDRESLAKLISGYDPPGTDETYDGNYYDDQFKGKGHINKKGLSKNGKTLIELMIRRGMIIDIDHMSMHMTNDLFNFLDTTIIINRTDTVHYDQYPLLAGHTNFLSQKFSADQTSNCEPCKMKMKDEHAKTDYVLNKIRNSGGIVCPITENDNDVQPGIFKYECPGSSKYFAEAYLYALEKMGNKNVGIGTDMNGFGGQLCPRFATYSSYALRGDLIRQSKIGNRRYLALNQDNGVKYENNLSDCSAHKFSGTGVFSKLERNIWQAIFAAHSDSKIKLSKFQKKIVRGIRTAIETKIQQEAAGDKLDEIEAAGYILAKKFECNIQLNTDSVIKVNNLNKLVLIEKINLIDSIYRSYVLLKGINLPMVRYGIQTRNGIRDFDYNIDGLAHYGLIPDFIQDLKNIGLSNSQLTPLFNSAKDFTELMEKCEEIRDKLGHR